MSGYDRDFEFERELTRRFEEIEARLRADMRDMIAREVRGAGLTQAQLVELVRHIAQQQRRPALWRDLRLPEFLPAWWFAAVALAAAAAILVLVLLWSGSGRGGQAAADAPPVATPSHADPVPPVRHREPVVVSVENFEALLRHDRDVWTPIVRQVRRLSVGADLRNALALWESGTVEDGGTLRRIEHAMVQVAVTRILGVSVAVDGVIDYEGCRGESCPAVRQWWEANGGRSDVPPFPQSPRPHDYLTVGRHMVIDYLRTTAP